MPEIREPDFLVVGLQKCGTFWITALLDAHPEINCIPPFDGGKTGIKEVHLFDTLGTFDVDGGHKFRRLFSRKHEGFFKDLVPMAEKVGRQELHVLFKARYSEWCDKFRKKELVGEKTTEYIFHLDLIDSFYPSIKKICILRNPKDRIVSFHYHQLRKGKKTEKTITDDFISDYLVRVKREYECMLEYPGWIHCLTYEDLSSSPEQALTGLLNYLGASLSITIISDMMESASFRRLSGKDRLYSRKLALVTSALLRSRTAHSLNQIIEKKYGRKGGEESTDSHYRKGVVGDWKTHFTPDQVDLIDKTVEKLQQEVFAKYRIHGFPGA